MNIATDCSGIETILMALELLGINYNHIFSSEIDKGAIEFITNNFPSKMGIFENLTLRSNRDLNTNIDLYCAGFPCQSFSSLGREKGFEDENRGQLFFHIYDFIKVVKPTVFILENVVGLLTNDKGRTFETICRMLEELQIYDISVFVLNTCDYGIPQSRRRVYFIGIKKTHIKGELREPPTRPMKSIYDILDTTLTNSSDLSQRNIELFENIYEKYPFIYEGGWILNLNVSSIKWFRIGKRGTSPCLATSCDYYVVDLNRKLTPKEALMLQGVPYDKYDWSNLTDRQQYKLAGNAMSVNVLYYLLKEIFKVTIVSEY
jgi:DNA (cytosine-5)-methyltransferase 1